MTKRFLAERSSLLVGVLLAAFLLAYGVFDVDTRAQASAEAGFKRALTTFAIARAVNATISVVKSSELAAQPFGVGMKVTVGEVLDPIDDLVETFSSLMLAASVAFGVALALMKLGAHGAVTAVAVLALLVWAAALWRRADSRVWLARVLALALLVRFALPLAMYGSGAVFDGFLEKDYAAARAEIDQGASKLEQAPVAAADPRAEESMAERIKRWFAEPSDFGNQIDRLRQWSENAAEHVVKLIVIFALQTLLLPVLLLWLMLRAARMTLAAGSSPRAG